MAGRHVRTRARKGASEILGAILMGVRATRIAVELGRLYSLWLEATGDGQTGGEEGSGVDVPLDGGDIPGQGGDLPSVGADPGVGWGGFDGFGGFGSFGG